MKLRRVSAIIRIIVSALILYKIQDGTFISKYNIALIIFCCAELVLDTCYIVLDASVKK